jgi:conjugal transfer pilus assembly protein TraU
MLKSRFMIASMLLSVGFSGPLCSGHFVNPITDIDWDALFPLTLGQADVVSGSLPDTSNPSSPLCVCGSQGFPRIGVSFGYWEPFAVTDVTRTPFCMVNLGGVELHVGNLSQDIGGATGQNAGYDHGSFYWVHWYKYPLIAWLQILTNVACMESGNYDIAYMAELDPTWNDDELSFILNPEAVLFGNPASQASCVADSIKTERGNSLPYNSLFWCMGSQGSSYPLDGSVSVETSPIQATTLLTERMDYKLHREGLIWDSVGQNSPALCTEHQSSTMPKDRYRYQLINSIPDATGAYPFGTTTSLWEAGHEDPGDHNNFGFLVWRKRNCCFL